jgi:hypothetical protein
LLTLDASPRRYQVQSPAVARDSRIFARRVRHVFERLQPPRFTLPANAIQLEGPKRPPNVTGALRIDRAD